MAHSRKAAMARSMRASWARRRSASRWSSSIFELLDVA
jgi:hypothetical protein